MMILFKSLTDIMSEFHAMPPDRQKANHVWAELYMRTDRGSCPTIEHAIAKALGYLYVPDRGWYMPVPDPVAKEGYCE